MVLLQKTWYGSWAARAASRAFCCRETGDRGAIVYRYDPQGRLILVRALDDASLGTPIAYGIDGTPHTEAFTADFGARGNPDGLSACFAAPEN
jgi:hypothetical protein